MHYSRKDCLRGVLIYALGDGTAAWIIGEFRLTRMLGMMLVGGALYAVEIPNYFRWIDRRVPAQMGFRSAVRRTLLALAYFNPLWIARHIFFIKLFSGEWQAIHWDLLRLGATSFLANIPLSLLANYLIQSRCPYRCRFAASAAFSTLMAIYYALSEVLFG